MTLSKPVGGLDMRFAEAMGQLIGPSFPSDIGLAVSGGGDSMAMLTLAHNWSRVWGVRLWVATVDHGLRGESPAEAAMVAQICDERGLGHATLPWHWDGQGNVMDAARQARLHLINQWRGCLSHVLMAHTKDDVAETFLMRLKRGSGVDGLAAMAPKRRVELPGPREAMAKFSGTLPPRNQPSQSTPSSLDRFDVIRPCLDMKREELRHYLRVLKGCWVDDPTNENDAYDRARIRKMLPLLETEGLGVDVLAATALRLTRAKDALRNSTQVAVECCVSLETSTGDVFIARDAFAALDLEIQLRLLAGVLQNISGEAYRPRLRPLEDLLERLLSGGGATLGGCEARALGAQIRVWRELSAVKDVVQIAEPGMIWDERWQLTGTPPIGATIRALGQSGWEQLPTKPKAAPPHASARSLPSVWQGDTLVACPALGFGQDVAFHILKTGLTPDP